MRKKRIAHLLEAGLVYPLYYLCRIIGMDAASFLMGKIMRFIGPFLSVSKVALSNIQKAGFEFTPEQKREWLKDVWENLGRVIGEFPHMPGLTGKRFATRVEYCNHQYAEDMIVRLKKSQPVIAFSGHFANWEIMPKVATEHGFSPTLVYRGGNNPYTDALIRRTRRNDFPVMAPKGRDGVRTIVDTMKNGKLLAMLVDQKMNNGIEVPLFNRPAMTAPALAELGLKYGATLYPVQIIRKKGAYFIVTFHPPLDLEGKTTKEIMGRVNQLFEGWIREAPAQWLWLHRRWPKETI